MKHTAKIKMPRQITLEIQMDEFANLEDGSWFLMKAPFNDFQILCVKTGDNQSISAQGERFKFENNDLIVPVSVEFYVTTESKKEKQNV